MEIPDDARRHLTDDHVVWLTTVSDTGAPSPYPVWFVSDGDDVVVYTKPSARRVANLAARPQVSLNFNCDLHGGDVWIITGTATVRHGIKPSGTAAYVAKYGRAVVEELQTTVDAIDAEYDTEIRITPIAVRTV